MFFIRKLEEASSSLFWLEGLGVPLVFLAFSWFPFVFEGLSTHLLAGGLLRMAGKGPAVLRSGLHFFRVKNLTILYTKLSIFTSRVIFTKPSPSLGYHDLTIKNTD